LNELMSIKKADLIMAKVFFREYLFAYILKAVNFDKIVNKDVFVETKYALSLRFYKITLFLSVIMFFVCVEV